MTDLRSRLLRRRLQRPDFSIVSDDCWGGEVYKALERPFRTPFIGLLIGHDSYLRLLEDLESRLARPLELVLAGDVEFGPGDPGAAPHVPVGYLGGDVEIRFLHYGSVAEVREKWQRRLERLDFARLFVKFAGDTKPYRTPLCELERFDALPYASKVCFTTGETQLASAVRVRHPTSDGALMFSRSLPHFDVVGWLNGTAGDPGPMHRALYAPERWRPKRLS